jgi:hypothetical protein
VHGQIDRYTYHRELSGIAGQWHKIRLPDNIFAHAAYDLSDVRIFGITADEDTIEAPYTWLPTDEKTWRREVKCNIINKTHRPRTASFDGGYYFTFELPTSETINRMTLDFGQENFDWRLSLEGSQDQQEWDVIAENYRILSIQNDLAAYRFTDLRFTDVKYRDLRILVAAEEQPELLHTGISLVETLDGDDRSYPYRVIRRKTDEQRKQTKMEIALESPVRVNYLKLDFRDSIDFYRPVTVEYLTDSVKTEKGWRTYYSRLTNGAVSSLEKNEFSFDATMLERLRVIIHNHDNLPLSVKDIAIKGNIPDMVVRFHQPAGYILCYGRPNGYPPSYDIAHFQDKIPAEMEYLALGEEKTSGAPSVYEASPLFRSPYWLWGVMAAIILSLGWCSLKMLGKR